MTDQTERDPLGLACEHGMLARACEVCELHSTIRALEAKAKGFKWLVEQHKHDADELRADRDRLAGEVESYRHAATTCELGMESVEAECARLFRELKDATERADDAERACDAVKAMHWDERATVARLTSELAAAREDAEKWEQYANTLHEDAERMTFMTFHRHDGLDGQTVRNWVDQRSLRMTYRGAIDAARRAGEGEA